MNRENAIKQIEEITQVMRSSFSIALPGNLLIAIGLGVAAIPLIEMFLGAFVDPWLTSMHVASPIIFGLRTVFYWTSFTALSRCFARKEKMALHPAIKKAWGLNALVPLVCVATAAMLAISGYSDLIASIMLIFIGCYFALLGRFTQGLITVLALVLTAVGIGSIYLTTLGIANLWMYLIAFQGVMMALTGLVLRHQQS